ncbi:MAG: YdiU family protein [Planctomycetes bacterium]|nr:YdiU family protein [Planctomycetota bacterium]
MDRRSSRSPARCSSLGAYLDSTSFSGPMRASVETVVRFGEDMTGAIFALLPTRCNSRVAALPGIGVAHEELLLAWLQRWWKRVRSEAGSPDQLAAAMDRTNPKYVLRNWLAQEAIDAAHADDLSKLERLLRVMEHPFDEQPEHEELAQKRPEWARHKAGCSMLSCSS